MQFAHLLICGDELRREKAHRPLVSRFARLFKAVQAVLRDEMPLRSLFGEHSA